MAKSSNPTHIPLPPKLIPKEEPNAQPLNRPESPNPFLPALQVEFNFNEITFNTNNEVALLYPSHSNSKYFKVVSDFISKCCLKEACTRAPNQYKEYLSKFWYTAKTIEENKIWVSTPTRGNRGKDDIIHKLNNKSREKVVTYPWFISILLEYMMPEYENDELTLNPTQIFSVYNWALKPNQLEGPPFTRPHEGHLQCRCACGSSTSPTGFKTGHSDQEAQSGLTVDTNPSQPSVSINVDADLPKEDQQAAGGPTSLGATSEEGAHPQFSSDKTKSAGNGLKVTHTDLGTNEESSSAEISKIIKLEDLSKLIKDADKDEDTHATFHEETEDPLVPHPPSPKTVQLRELTNQVLLLQYLYKKLEQQKNKAKAEVALLIAQPSYPNVDQLKELSSKFTILSREVKDLKKHVQGMEIMLPGDLKEIPNKLETFISTISSLTSQVAELKTLHPPRSSPQIEGELIKKDKGKATMFSKDDEEEETESDSKNDYANPIDLMVESSKKKKLKKFDFVTEGGEHVHFTTEKIKEQKRIEESLKAELAKQEVEKVKNDLVDLMGIDVVTKYYKNKLLYDKYYDKMLNRRKSSKIINCDVLTRRGPITLKVYREDGTTKVIPNFKTSDLHLAKWKEVVQACSNKKGKGWKTIYEQIKTRMDYLYHTEEELKIDFNKPIKE
ncbi:hypothetical protein Tco_0116763 [Tanacetum coccineum]